MDFWWCFFEAPKPPGFHTTTRELQTCTFQGPGASNTTKIPRKDPQEREGIMTFVVREEKKERRGSGGIGSTGGGLGEGGVCGRGVGERGRPA